MSHGLRRLPPWLPETLLWLLLRRADWRDTVIGDLREEYQARLRHGLRADTWYWREALSLALSGVRGLGAREAAPGRGRPPRGDLIMMKDVLPDIRIALRLIRRQPAFSGAIVLILGLGIASTAVIFNVLDAIVLRVMDLPNPDRLVIVSETTPTTSPEDRRTAPANFLDWRAGTTAFDYMGAYDPNEANLASPGGEAAPERVTVTSVSANLLDVLGATPQAGRFIDSGDEPHGRPAVTVLSDGLWRRRFGADTSVIGRTLLLDEVPYTIVGVAREGFTFPYGTGLWTALSMSPAAAQDREREYLTVVARLREGATIDAARAELATVSARLQQAYPATNLSVTAVAIPMRAAIRDEGGPAMIGAWQTAAALVLLIACVNVAQMLLSRGTTRQREFTVRAALGAGLGRLVRQLVTEGMILSALAGLVSLGISWIALRAMKASMPEELTRFVYGWQWLGVDGRLVAFTMTMALLAAGLFSLLPALHASRVDLNDTLKQGGRGTVAGMGWKQPGLVVAEMAFAFMLTTATALTVSGSAKLLYGHPGYETAGVLTATVALPDLAYPSADARRQFYDRTLERLAAVPGIERSALVNAVPAGDYNTSRSVVVEGEPARDSSDPPRADYRVVSSGYFEAMGIPVLQGRPLLATDGPESLPVAVVSKAFAARFWPGLDPLGRRYRLGPDGPWITVVGVSGDVVHHWFGRRHYPTMYRPYAQDPRPVTAFVMKAHGDALGAAPSVRAALTAIDPHLPLFNVQSLQRLREINVTGLYFLVRVMSVLGGLAVLLACAGIYAVMTYGIAQRRREIGVRIALGAAPSGIVRLAGSQVARLTGLGLGIGFVGAMALGKLLASTLFGLVSLDPLMYAAAAGALATVAAIAGMIPVRRALAIDPVATLRED